LTPAPSGTPAPPPGPKGRRLLGSLFDVRGDRIRFVTRARAEYGDVVGFRMGSRNLALVSSPDAARHVLNYNAGNYHKGLGLRHARALLGNGLLTSEDELWSARRRLLRASFQKDRVQGYAGAIIESTAAMLDRWGRMDAEGAPVDVDAELSRLTIGIVGRALFSTALEDRAGRIAADLDAIGKYATKRMASLLPAEWEPPGPAAHKAKRSLRSLERTVQEIADAHPSEAGDLLDLLIRGTALEPDPRRAVRDEVMTLLLAGHETTATCVTWALHLLATHLPVLRRLQREVDEELEGCGPSATDAPRLPYARMVVEETLRLYPPVWMLPRRALHEDIVGGYRIRAGCDVLISVYSMHRHPAFWPDPDRFRPERFRDDEPAIRASGAYLPFGSGPRACIGSQMGLLEAVLILASAVGRFDFEPCGRSRPEPVGGLSLRPRDGLRLRAFARIKGPPARRENANVEKPAVSRCPYHSQGSIKCSQTIEMGGER
jgi:cytochrome P450